MDFKHRLTGHALPAHGGDLQWAETTFGVPKAQWLDVSTGISPWTWPVPQLPPHVWRDLPPSPAKLLQAAAHYYAWPAKQIAPTPGSQWAIATMPKLVPLGVVALPTVGYQEHETAWRGAGHTIQHYDDITQLAALINNADVNYVVVINPNNPSTARASSERLLALATALFNQQKASLFMIDEAFADDVTDSHFVAESCPSNLLRLRSVGKFFGLAGLRLGFVLASPEWAARLNAALPTWANSHPALYIGEKALSDSAWIQAQRVRIQQNAAQLRSVLSAHYGEALVHSAGLFCSVFGEKQGLLQDFIHFAEQGMLTRFIACDRGIDKHNAILRFGLPGDRWPTFHSCFNKTLQPCATP